MTFREWLQNKELTELTAVNTQTVTQSLAPILGLQGLTANPGNLARTMLKTPGLASFPVMMAAEPAVQDAVAKLNAKTKPKNVQNVNNAVPVTGALPGTQTT